MGPGGPYRFFTKILMQGDAFCNHRYILEG